MQVKKPPKKYRILKIRNVQSNLYSYHVQKRRSFLSFIWWTTIKDDCANFQIAKQYVCNLIINEPGPKLKVEEITEL